MPSVIFNSQLANTVLAIAFFYFIPYFGITPKVTLFIYLAISFILIVVWRMWGVDLFYRRKLTPAVIIGQGPEFDELRQEIKDNHRYGLALQESAAKIIIADPRDERLYEYIFSDIKFVNAHALYEEIFRRVPLYLITRSWVLENISNHQKSLYTVLKRVMDFSTALILGVVSLILYPFIILAIKLDSLGPIFCVQERMGAKNKIVRLVKFRSMTSCDGSGAVTSVGNFLRKMRLDELPQLWNVLEGDLSLVGPRPELPNLVEEYSKAIPFYNVRHIIQPGLSGWAQLYAEHPHHAPDLAMTRHKLSCDIYYVKNRSFWLDLKIALRTIKTLVSRVGI